MGKIKTKRQKLHASAPSARKEDVDVTITGWSCPEVSLVPPGAEFPTRGLFSQGALPADTGPAQHPLTGRRNNDEEDDRHSFISKKSIKSGRGSVSKKEKRKERHDRWLQKIDAIQTAKKRTKDAKKRSERPIIGDLNPLTQALPELSEIMALSHRKTQEARKAQEKKQNKSTMKARERQQLLLEESTRFKQVLQHSAFKSNPFSAINKHLRNKEQDT